MSLRMCECAHVRAAAAAVASAAPALLLLTHHRCCCHIGAKAAKPFSAAAPTSLHGVNVPMCALLPPPLTSRVPLPPPPSRPPHQRCCLCTVIYTPSRPPHRRCCLQHRTCCSCIGVEAPKSFRTAASSSLRQCGCADVRAAAAAINAAAVVSTASALLLVPPDYCRFSLASKRPTSSARQ